MPRLLRNDTVGAWHHVMNRGLARRTLFENDRDIRYFLSRLALAVRAGCIEVHAYCFLTTHFHLLLRSPLGGLSEVMQRVQNEYARWFNRGRRRDGPLFRSRFHSKRADCLTYRRHLVRYIDYNPVSARLAAAPAVYPHGSARCYARDKGPRWLERSWIEDIARARSQAAEYNPLDYAAVFGEVLSPRLMNLIAKRIQLSNDQEDPLDDLLAAAPPQIVAWMRRKASLADGTDVGMPVCDGDSVDEVVAEARDEQGDWVVNGSNRLVSAWPLAHGALLRELCGATLREVGRRTQVNLQSAGRRYARHQVLIETCPEYGLKTAQLAARALDRCHR
jgi:REP element-mobilizing transposase RayT